MLLPSLRLISEKTEIDRAVLYGAFAKAWQIPSGVVTLLLIAFFFDPESQGVYYTIFGILGLQNMAEAGLTSVLMHSVSHEWSKVEITDEGELVGDANAIGRIAALTRGSLKCLTGSGIAFAIIALTWGTWLFWNSPVIVGVLVLSVLVSGLSLASAGLIAVLEGCNQVRSVNRNRFGQVICGSLVVWAVIAAGGTIWAIPASLATQLLWELSLLGIRYRRVMQRVFAATASDLDWKNEIWPLQWKLGLQGFVHQMAFTPMIPVLAAWQGLAVAGMAGMTLNTLIQLLGIASMWIRTRAPRFGELIANGERQNLDRLFLRTVYLSTTALCAILAMFCGVLFLLGGMNNEIAQKLASRFLPVSLAIGIATAMVALHLLQCFAIYLRAHKVDPIWRITIFSNLLLIVAIVVGEARFGAIAMGVSMTAIYGGITLPLVFLAWRRYRRESIQAEIGSP
ncbi:MAG: hypothetical protein AB8B91_11915 [Rubripirellula sp.]